MKGQCLKMDELRKQEIKNFIEVECKDWCEFKLLDINKKDKKTFVYIIDNCLFIFPNDIKTKSLEEIFQKIGLNINKNVA